MSKRDRRDGDRGRDRDRRDMQPDEEQQRRTGEELQESESLTALKAILSKVAALLQPLQLDQEESTRLVEQLYGSVLAMDTQLAGEADDSRKSSVLYHIQNTTIARDGDKLVVEYPTARPAPSRETETPAAPAAEAPGEAKPAGAEGAPPEAAAPVGPGDPVQRPAPRPRPNGAGGPPATRRKPAGENEAPSVAPQQAESGESAPADSGPPED